MTGKLRKFILAGVIAAVSVLVGARLSLPGIVRWRVHKTYPEASIDRVVIHWFRLEFDGVKIDRGWLTADVKSVHVNPRTELVQLEHGEVHVNLDKKPETQGGSANYKVIGRDLQLIVTKGDCTATLHDAALQDKELLASDAVVACPDYPRAKLDHVEVSRDLHHAKVAAVHFPDGLRYKDLSPVVSMEMVSVDVPNRALGIGHVTLEVQAQGIPTNVEVFNLDVKAIGDHAHIKAGLAGIEHPWISKHQVVFHDVETTVGPNVLEEPLDLTIAGAKVLVNPKLLQVQGVESCQTWAKAMPDGLRDGPLGTPAFSGELTFDIALKPKPLVKTLTSTCKSACTASQIQALKHRFTYVAYDQNGEPFERTTGPEMTDDWIPISDVNANLPLAVMNMEDLAFRSHHGFIPEAIENSLVEDVRTGKFGRGGSTITMQLAKNVWLRRDKTVGRKVEELLLSQVLESCFSKDEILELYLNVVEFGPNLYGVGPAARHYFQARPLALSGAESFYLAWLLPRPRKSPPPTRVVMDQMAALMRMLVTKGRVPDMLLLDVDQADTSGWTQAAN